MKAYKSKIKRDLVASMIGREGKYGVYVKATKNYLKGEEIYLGYVSEKNKRLFDEIINIIK